MEVKFDVVKEVVEFPFEETVAVVEFAVEAAVVVLTEEDVVALPVKMVVEELREDCDVVEI